MLPRRVFIISASLTIRNDLKNLLSEKAGIELVGAEKDINQAIHQIDTLRPDILIWEDRGLKDDGLEPIIHLLRVRAGLKIIGLDLQDWEIMTYQATKDIAHDAGDLIEAIKFTASPVTQSDFPVKEAVEQARREELKSEHRENLQPSMA